VPSLFVTSDFGMMQPRALKLLFVCLIVCSSHQRYTSNIPQDPENGTKIGRHNFPAEIIAKKFYKLFCLSIMKLACGSWNLSAILVSKSSSASLRVVSIERSPFKRSTEAAADDESSRVGNLSLRLKLCFII
jgi:hypothetical protein